MRLRCGHKENCPCPLPPVPEQNPDFFVQFGVTANPPSGSDLPLIIVFQKGENIYLDEGTDIILEPGYLYQIDYIFLAVPEAGGYMQITPKMNGSLRTLYSFFAPAGTGRNASASGSFTTNEAAANTARLSFNLVYPDTVKNIDISGAVSVTPLMKI